MASFCFVAGVRILALLRVRDPRRGARHGLHPALFQLLGVGHEGVDLPGLHQLEEASGVALGQVPHLVAQQRDGGVGSDVLPRTETAVGGRGWAHRDVPCKMEPSLASPGGLRRCTARGDHPGGSRTSPVCPPCRSCPAAAGNRTANSCLIPLRLLSAEKTNKQSPKYPVQEAERALSEGHFLGNSLPAPQNLPNQGQARGGPGCEGPAEIPWCREPRMPGPKAQSRREGA